MLHALTISLHVPLKTDNLPIEDANMLHAPKKPLHELNHSPRMFHTLIGIVHVLAYATKK